MITPGELQRFFIRRELAVGQNLTVAYIYPVVETQVDKLISFLVAPHRKTKKIGCPVEGSQPTGRVEVA